MLDALLNKACGILLLVGLRCLDTWCFDRLGFTNLGFGSPATKFNRYICARSAAQLCEWLLILEIGYKQVYQAFKLNINSMESSIVSLPYDYENEDIVVSETREGRIDVFGLVCSFRQPQHLHYSIMQNESENAN